MIGGQWKERYDRVPRDIRLFLVRGLIVFVAWQLLYNLLLAPAHTPDRQLTDVTAYVTMKIANAVYGHAEMYGHPDRAVITLYGKKILGIADPCNALEIYVLYVAFLFCYPAPDKRRLIFVLAGVPLIFMLNVVRCSLLLWLNLKHRGWFNISHHYIFNTVVYLLVFYLWIQFSKKTTAHDT